MVTPCQISLPPTLHAVRMVPSDSLLSILGGPGTWGLCLSWEVLWDLSPHSPLPGGAPWRGEGRLGLPCASPLWPGHVARSVCSGSPIPTPLGGWASRSHLASRAVLQGLLQGVDDTVHILPGGIAAQQADAKHLL